MIKAVIFDLDGVIADTEPIQERARNELLREFGLPAEKMSAEAIGRGKREWWESIVREYGLPYTGEEVAVRDFTLCLRYIKKMHLAPTEGVCDLLQYLRSSNIKAAVASSSDRFYVESVLKLMRLEEYFCGKACGDEVDASKPAPFIYERALALCGVRAEDACAVEDSDTGAQAANAAGILCVGYDSPKTAVKQSFVLCEYKAQTMQEILEYIGKIHEHGFNRR